MLYSTVSPDSTQTDAEKQDFLDAKDKRSGSDKLKELIDNNVQFEFCKPNTTAFSAYRERTREAHSVSSSPCKPKLTVDVSKCSRIGTCKSIKRSRDYDSPVSTLEEVYKKSYFYNQ